jgi:hypothetical protein
MDEVEKMKQQKAQVMLRKSIEKCLRGIITLLKIRCEYLQSKRENTMLQDKIDDLNKHLVILIFLGQN